jgi:hypothetical protein
MEGSESRKIKKLPDHVRWADVRFLSFDTCSVVAFEREKREVFEFQSKRAMANALEELFARDEVVSPDQIPPKPL